MALADLGVERVLAKVEIEPPGEAFNSISLEPGTGRPLNRMISVSCRWPAFNPAPPMW
ncbi:MAG: glutaminase [Chromatiaceae bacterium]